MDIIASTLEPNWTIASIETSTTAANVASKTDIEFIFNGVIIPLIGAFGVIGNLLNLIILSWRYNKREVGVLEKGALLGLIALAVSDMMFCLVIVPHAFFYKHKTIFMYRSARMYYQVYGIYLQNVFIKTSTCLTLVVGLARYIGICHPLRARICIGLHGMRAACILTYVVWLLLMLPMIWMYTFHELPVPATNSTIYIIDLGVFSSNKQFSMSFTYMWALVGYFVPVAILVFCNLNLIHALRQSMRFRQATVRSTSSNRDVSTRITMTLIALIVMYILLVSPSEILHFISDIVDTKKYRDFELAVIFTNVLQAVNFAFHFVLYCTVNVTFRRIFMRIPGAIVRCFQRIPHLGSSSSQSGDVKYQHALLPTNNSRYRQSSFKSSCRTSITRCPDNETYL